MNKYTQDILIINKLGLHARASAKLTQLAGCFNSQIFIAKHSKRVNAKSIMGVMMLAAGFGTQITLEVEGEDAEQAFTSIKQLFSDKFGEAE